MATNRIIIMFLAMAAIITMYNAPCRSAQKDKSEKSIWPEEESRGPERGRGGPGRGPEREPGPAGIEIGRGPGGPERFELTDEEVSRILNILKQSDPNAVMKLEKMRKEDPEKFQAELRKYGREEFGKIIRERIDGWRRQRQTDFIQWLGKNYPKESENLAKLRQTDPNVYMEKYDHIRNKYWPIFDEERRNPELAEILKEDLVLKDKRDEMVIKIKAAKNEKDKQVLMTELEEVASRRFDLIVRRKEIEYERLLKWLEELRNRVRESRDEIAKWKDENFKKENVKKHIKDLTEPSPQFRFD